MLCVCQTLIKKLLTYLLTRVFKKSVNDLVLVLASHIVSRSCIGYQVNITFIHSCSITWRINLISNTSRSGQHSQTHKLSVLFPSGFWNSAAVNWRWSSAAVWCSTCGPVTKTRNQTKTSRLPAVYDWQQVHAQEMATSIDWRKPNDKTRQVAVTSPTSSTAVHLSQEASTPGGAPVPADWICRRAMGASLCGASFVWHSANQRRAAWSRVQWWQGLVHQQVWTFLYKSLRYIAICDVKISKRRMVSRT